MASSRSVLKSYFQTGDKPTQNQFGELIDNMLHKVEDMASLEDVANNENKELYINPSVLYRALQELSPVLSVNNQSPAHGNVNISNITGTASSITGNITQSQVTGLNAALSALGATLMPKHLSAIAGDHNLSGFALQDLFPVGNNKFNLLAKKTYIFRGRISLLAGTTSHITTFGWLAQSLTVDAMDTNIDTSGAPTLTGVTTTNFSTRITGATTKAINTSVTSAFISFTFDGILRTGATAGTIAPLIGFNVDTGATAVVKRGSFIEFQELGSDAVVKIGNVS